MIIKSKTEIPAQTLKSGQKKRILPVIPVRSEVLFPGQALTLQLNRAQNLSILKEAGGRKKQIALVYSPLGEIGERKFDLCQIGCAGKIISIKDGLGKSKLVVIEGTRRVLLTKIKRRRPFLRAETQYLELKKNQLAIDPFFEKELYNIIEQIAQTNPVYADSLSTIIKLQLESLGQVIDRIAMSIPFPVEIRQELLETIDLEPRLEVLKKNLSIDLKNRPIALDSSATLSAANPKKYIGSFLKPGIDQVFADEIESNKTLPAEIREKCLIELDRLKNLPSASSDYGTTRQYLDMLLGIPWNKYSEEDYELENVEKMIDKDYYGPGKVKRRVLERIAIRKLSGKSDEASVLCLAGVAGTGKASLAKAIARSLGKEFIRISVGSVDDVPDIKGYPRTLLNASPGIFARSLKNAGSVDPVILIENVDYLTGNSGSLTEMALLEAIDPRLNSAFIDDYLGTSIDLGRVFFIISVKSAEDIPETIYPRLEVIELPGYIEKEKIHISRKYIIPKLLKRHGLLRKDVSFGANGLLKIIRNYTLEAGLLTLKGKLELICRQIAKEKAGGRKRRWIINEKTVSNYLGTPEYSPEKPGKKPEVGVATGLAWTGLGGDLMTIEALKMKGSGEVISTGSLGEVMKESIQASHSYIRSKADILGIDHADFSNFDIHIHFPSGAIPKDGPSAGVAVCLVIASVMSERPIPHSIAMTGEVTLRGKVLQVGGLIEKMSAAYRAGIKTVFLPKDNQKDLIDLPEDILKKTKFVLIESVDEIFTLGLKDFVPSAFTLEKIFAQEIEKAKSRKNKSKNDPIAARGRRNK